MFPYSERTPFFCNIIRGMERLDFDVLVRIALPLILIPLLGISARPHEVDNILEWANPSREIGAPLEVSERVVQAAEYLPWRLDLWELAGIYALRGGNPDAAIHHFQKAQQGDGLSLAGWIYLGDAAMMQGDLQVALASWQLALERENPPNELYSRLAEVSRQAGDYPSAISALEELARSSPQDVETHFQLGMLLAAYEPVSALTHLERAAELDPAYQPIAVSLRRTINTARLADDPAFTLISSGRTLASLDQWELAALAFRRATELRPDYAEAWAFLGEAHQRLQTGGYEELQRALSLDPLSISANTFMALHWQRQDRQDLALVYLHAAAAQNPHNPVLQAELGNTLAILGNLPDAHGYYQRAAELTPREPTYWRSLASFSIKYEYHLQDIALPAARQALLLDKEDPASLDLMGQVYIRLDDPLSAERFLLQALQVDPGYAQARLHLGFVYLLKGDYKNAREQLTLARTLASPDTAVSDQAGRLLQSYFP